MSYTIFTFPLFFDLIPCSFILISFRLYDVLAFYYVFLIQLPTTSITPSSVLHPSSTFPSPSFLSSIFHHPHHFFLSPCLPTPCLSVPFYYYLSNICSLFLASLFWLRLPYIPSLVTLWVIFYILCTTPSFVIYKSFWLVVYSLACNCCPLLPTQYPLSLPQSHTNLSPDNTLPLCFPCLSPLKLRTPLFLGEGVTHKLKPSPYPYAAVFCNLSTALCALYSTPSRLWHSFDLIPSSFHIHSLTSSALHILSIL